MTTTGRGNYLPNRTGKVRTERIVVTKGPIYKTLECVIKKNEWLNPDGSPFSGDTGEVLETGGKRG